MVDIWNTKKEVAVAGEEGSWEGWNLPGFHFESFPESGMCLVTICLYVPCFYPQSNQSQPGSPHLPDVLTLHLVMAQPILMDKWLSKNFYKLNMELGFWPHLVSSCLVKPRAGVPILRLSYSDFPQLIGQKHELGPEGPEKLDISKKESVAASK
jgi:hypothetical protein